MDRKTALVVGLLLAPTTNAQEPSSTPTSQPAPLPTSAPASQPASPAETEPIPDALAPMVLQDPMADETWVIAPKPRAQKQLASILPQTYAAREEFQYRPDRQIGDVIKRMPGVFMGGPLGENKDIRLRGLDKEFARFELGGFQLPDPGEKREFQVDRLSSYMVDEVILLRTPTAAEESDGIAGRMQATLRPIPKDPFFEGAVSAGGVNELNGDMFRASLGAGMYLTPKLGFMFAFDQYQDRLIKTKERVVDEVTTEAETEDVKQPYTSATADLGYFYGQGELHVRPLLLSLDEQKIKDKEFTGDSPKLESEEERKNQETLGLSIAHKHNTGKGLSGESQAGFFVATETKDKGKDFFVTDDTGEFVTDKNELEDEVKRDATTQAMTKWSLPVGKITLQGGGALRLRERSREKEKLELKNGSLSDKGVPKDDYSLSEDYFAAFFLGQANLTPKLSATAGLRLEQVFLDLTASDGTEAESAFTDLNPSTIFLYKASERLSLRGGVARTLARPKFDDLAPFTEEKNDRVTRGNPELAPARSLGADLGGEYSGNTLFLGVNLFQRQIAGVLEEVDTGELVNDKPLFQVENVGDGYLRGIELEQRFSLGFTKVPLLQAATFWANQSLLTSELVDSTGEARPFKNQPRFIANVGLLYDNVNTGTITTIAANYVGARVDATATKEKIEAPDFLVDLSVRQRLKGGLSAFFELENVTNDQRLVTDTNLENGTFTQDIEQIGRTFFLGLSYQYQDDPKAAKLANQ